ncbi:hypothetical protein PMAYCL1PPCAC_05012, partial [Pristionchus mayeri]
VDEINQEEPISDVSSFYEANEIKEEPVEMKNEPFVDCKQDEPIADMYCPSTGISRPLDQSTSSNYVDIPSKIKSHKCVVCLRLCDENEMRVFTTDPKKRAVWINTVRSTPEGRKSLLEKLRATTKQFLCEGHFLSSD